MKLNKIFTFATLATTMFFAASCSDSFEYTPADAPTGAQVYFSSEAPTEYTISEDGSSFSIPLKRANTSGSLSVPLKVSGTEGTIYTVPGSVSFNDGAENASIVVEYDASQMEYGRYDTLTIAINDASLTTPYGVSELKVVAGVTAWVDYGTALYREDLFTTFFGVGNDVYEVPIQKNIVKEGYYRLVNPYGAAYPYNDPGDWDDSVDSYMVINATDPDWVYVEDCETTTDWGYGVFSMYGYAYYLLLNGNSLDVIKANRPDIFGTLKDGIITMPAQSILISMADYNDGGLYYANANGLFGIALPGAAFADYSLEVSYSGIFTDANNSVFAVGNLTLGEDVKTVKAIVASASDDAAAVADAIAAGDLNAESVAGGRIEVPIAEGLSGKLQIVAVALDGNDVKAVSSANFEYYGGGVSPWESIGIGYYVDDFVVPLYTEAGEPYGYEVEIEENTETPGLYRIVNAYAPVAAGFGEKGGNESIEINAEDPDGVYILQQRIGLDFGYGDMSIVSEGGRYVAANGFDVVKQVRPDLLGTLKDDVITFPTFPIPNYDDYIYQGLLFEGTDGSYGGMNGAMEIYLPSAYTANSAKAKTKAQSIKNALKFERNLKSFKKASGINRIVSKKMVKNNAKVIKF